MTGACRPSPRLDMDLSRLAVASHASCCHKPAAGASCTVDLRRESQQVPTLLGLASSSSRTEGRIPQAPTPCFGYAPCRFRTRCLGCSSRGQRMTKTPQLRTRWVAWRYDCGLAMSCSQSQQLMISSYLFFCDCDFAHNFLCCDWCAKRSAGSNPRPWCVPYSSTTELRPQLDYLSQGNFPFAFGAGVSSATPASAIATGLGGRGLRRGATTAGRGGRGRSGSLAPSIGRNPLTSFSGP